LQLSPTDDRPDSEVDEVNSRLADGLRACRSIVSDYRAIITGDQDGEHFRPDTGQAQANQL
jgi:hypothetical protein